MAAVGSVAFGIGRIFLLETSIVGIYESSTIAYYSAESGIEEGFLRYRYNRNAEVPLPQNNAFQRTNITERTVSDSSVALATTPITTITDQIYDLNMKLYEQYYGDDKNNNGRLDAGDLRDNSYADIFIVPFDESQKIDITSAIKPSGDINLLFRKFMGQCQSGFLHTNAMVEIKLVGYIGGNLEEVKAVVLTPDYNGSNTSASLNAVRDGVALPSVYYVNNLLSSVYTQTGALTNFDRNKNVTLYFKPLVCPVSIGINPSMPDRKIASAFSTVESRGYYGGVGRMLRARIDRQAGTLYDLFDYVILDVR
jgi:hypothetical protein